MTETEKKRLEEYTRSVPAQLRGTWLKDWSRKCPCHVAAFNCAELNCSDASKESKEKP